MEDEIERNMHSLNSQNDMYFKENNNKLSKTLYVCSPSNNKFELNKCIITDNKEKMQELIKQYYKVSIFLTDINNDINNDIYNFSS
jgi:hypothetical protein